MRRGLRRHEEAYLAEIRIGMHSSVPETIREQAAAYAKRLMENDVAVLFDQKHLAYVTRIRSQVIGSIRSDPTRHYSDFLIAKRSGGSRLISAPSPTLKLIQDWIKQQITSRLVTHEACHGFVAGRSI